MSQEQLFQLALSFIPGVGSANSKLLLSYCGDVASIFSTSKAKLLKIPGIGIKTVNSILNSDALRQAEIESELISKHDIDFCFYLDEDYPDRLKQYPDAPILYYYKGQNFGQPVRSISIVGTREPSEYGRSMVQKLVSELKEHDVCIISGLAYGIDTCAHQESVKNGIATFGVLGQGLKSIYPAENRKLALQMLEKGGLISEFRYHAKADREHFPMRNRIIAALSDALIVVESAEKGGSIITANLANGYYKDVFAVPGRITDLKSKGCNTLIKENKAHVIESIQDLYYIMGWDQNNNNQIQLTIPIDLEENEQKIVSLLRTNEMSSIDQLHYKLQISLSELSALLLNLEFKGIIRSLPGKKYNLLV